jgi:hypothetical protein
MMIRAVFFLLLLLSCIEQCSSLNLGYKKVYSPHQKGFQSLSYSTDCSVRALGYNRCDTSLQCATKAFSSNHKEALNPQIKPRMNFKIAMVSENAASVIDDVLMAICVIAEIFVQICRNMNVYIHLCIYIHVS